MQTASAGKQDSISSASCSANVPQQRSTHGSHGPTDDPSSRRRNAWSIRQEIESELAQSDNTDWEDQDNLEVLLEELQELAIEAASIQQERESNASESAKGGKISKIQERKGRLRNQIIDLFAKGNPRGVAWMVKIPRLLRELFNETAQIAKKSLHNAKPNDILPPQFVDANVDSEDVSFTIEEGTRMAQASATKASECALFDSDGTIVERGKEIREELKIAEKQKTDMPGVLSKWRELINLYESKPGVKVWDSTFPNYVRRRRKSLSGIDKCIQDCWDNNEQAFCSNAPWPVVENYQCVCRNSASMQSTGKQATMASFMPTRAPNQTVSTTAKDIEDIATAQKRDQMTTEWLKPFEEFTLVKSRLESIEHNKQDKKALIKEWRRLRHLHQSRPDDNFWGTENLEFLKDRERQLKAVERCIDECWQKDKEAYFQSELPAWPKAKQKYCCTCKADESDETIPCPDILRWREEFAAAKKEIEQVEQQQREKLRLINLYRSFKHNFADRLGWISPSSCKWAHDRLKTLRQIDCCIEKCMNGNASKFIALPAWPGVGRSYTCQCHLPLVTQEKRSGKDKRKIDEGNDQDSKKAPRTL